MPSRDHKRIAQSWLTVQRHWWAYDAVRELCESSPHEALTLILVLVELAETPRLLEDIGAGPLEDLLDKHAAIVIDEIESQVSNNAALRIALSHVWLREGTSEVGRRLVALGCRVVPIKSADGGVSG
jgi:hypothetical protein